MLFQLQILSHEYSIYTLIDILKNLYFNIRSYWYHAFGFGIYWRQKMIPVPRQCLLQYNLQGEFVQLADLARLELGQFSVAFIVLFVGYVLALLQFLRERFILPAANQ